jgi:hypothetical protein
MSILLIPTFSDPNYFETTTLEGISYVLQFDFNQRAYSWYMSIADASGVDIYNGVKLVTGFSLLAKCKDPRAPPGQLFIVTTNPDGTPPGLYDLLPGGPAQLLYITSDWVAILAEPDGLQTLLAQSAATAANSSDPTSTYGQPPDG